MTGEQITSSARSHVSDWLSLNQERLGLAQIKLESKESPVKFLGVWFETPTYLIDIAVWEYAYCLDILILKQVTGKQVFSEAGSCKDTRGLSERLCLFSNWMAAHADAT